MQIFIDESGSFSGFHKGSIAVVGGLSVPDSCMPRLEKKYARIRQSLPLERGEVKGRNLTEFQVAKIVALLARNEAVVEITALDLAAHTTTGVSRFRDQLVDEMTARLPRFNTVAQRELREAIVQIRKTQVPLFLQAMATFDMLSNIIRHVPLYFAQRRPKELASFSWVVDGKDPAKITDWEIWWSWYARGALATRSKSDPMPTLEGADYTYYNRFAGRDEHGNKIGTDLNLLLSNLRFAAEPEPGLELVDIVTNALRRAMTNRLSFAGWSEIPQLMIHRRHQYISLMLLEGASKEPQHPPYENVVGYFRFGGKSMLSPRFLRVADEENID